MKGGVGKTALTHNAAYALAAAGRRVLLVDADPQSSLTSSCGFFDTANTLADVLRGSLAPAGAIRGVTQGLDLLPADITLSHVELTLVSRRARETVLQRALADVAGRYDVCLIDCPPSLSLLSVNAMTAAGAVLVPVQPQITDLRGLRLFLQTIDELREDLNPTLRLLAIVPTFYDARLLHHQDAIAAMTAAGWPVRPDLAIGRTVRIAEAAAGGRCLLQHAPTNKQAAAFRAVAEEIERWQNDQA